MGSITSNLVHYRFSIQILSVEIVETDISRASSEKYFVNIKMKSSVSVPWATVRIGAAPWNVQIFLVCFQCQRFHFDGSSLILKRMLWSRGLNNIGNHESDIFCCVILILITTFQLNLNFLYCFKTTFTEFRWISFVQTNDFWRVDKKYFDRKINSSDRQVQFSFWSSLYWVRKRNLQHEVHYG